MDGYDKITQGISKYIVPGLFFICGIFGLIVGLSVNRETGVEQSSWFINGGIVLTVMGLLMGLHIKGLFKRKIAIIFVPVLIALCGWFMYMNYMSVKERIDLGIEKDVYDESVKQALLDIRDIELAFKKTYLKYSSSAQELQSFLENGFVKYVSNKCDERPIPDGRMTLEQADSLGIDINTDEGNRQMERIDDYEAVALGLITRDTVNIPAMDFIFNGHTICPCNDSITNEFLYDVKVAPMNNPNKRAYAFDANQIWKKRSHEKGESYTLMADDIGDSTSAKPVFTVYDGNPFDPFNSKDTLRVGKLSKHMTEGNWTN
jgi:hypothetical protein